MLTCLFVDLLLFTELLEAWIPAAYLEALDEEYDEESKDSDPERYTVIEGYLAKSDDELSVDTGTVIEVCSLWQLDHL